MVDSHRGCLPRFFPARLLSEAKTQSSGLRYGVYWYHLFRSCTVYSSSGTGFFEPSVLQRPTIWSTTERVTFDLQYFEINIAPL
jgi:hypothetical protein